MTRPAKQRIIAGPPPATVYKPVGVPAGRLQWVRLALDEFEAIRLIDGEGLDQETAAARMGVSRPTVTRILASGRSKIARMLSGGQAIVIEGGPIVQAPAGWSGGAIPGRRGGRRWHGGRGMGQRRGRS